MYVLVQHREDGLHRNQINTNSYEFVYLLFRRKGLPRMIRMFLFLMQRFKSSFD